MLKRVFLALTAISLLLTYPAGPVRGGQISDQLKGAVDRIITLLRDPALKAHDRTLERRNRIFLIVEEHFDFTEMARRSVGEFWQEMSDAQQKEFEVAFSDLLEKSYITKMEKYTDEKVVFEAEKPKSDRYYAVRTLILASGHTIPVDYSLHEVDGQWLVYDVNIEGVSLVAHYLPQFREAIRKGGFNGLMGKLHEKLEGLSEGQNETVGIPKE